MSATVVTHDVDLQRRHPSIALPLGAVLSIVGSVGYVSVNSMTPREASLHPVGVAATMIATLGCLALSYSLVRLRTRLPRWAVLTSAAGIWFAGAVAWSHSTVVVAAATKTTNDEFDHLFLEDAWALGVGMAPKAVLCLVGFLGIALAGWRNGSIPRSAAVLFGLAGIASAWPPFPPALVLASTALLVIARARWAAE